MNIFLGSGIIYFWLACKQTYKRTHTDTRVYHVQISNHNNIKCYFLNLFRNITRIEQGSVNQCIEEEEKKCVLNEEQQKNTKKVHVQSLHSCNIL